MEKTTWERLGAANGIAFVALFTIGAFRLFSVEGPESGADADRISSFFIDNGPSFRLGLLLMLFGGGALLWFSASVWAALRGADPDGRLSAITLGAGMLTAGFSLATTGMLTSYTITDWDKLDAPVAQSLFETGGYAFSFIFVGGALLRAAFVGAASLATLRFGGLPKWLGWVGMIVALANLMGTFQIVEASENGVFSNVAFFSLIMGFSLWVLLASIYLVRYPKGNSAAPIAP